MLSRDFSSFIGMFSLPTGRSRIGLIILTEVTGDTPDEFLHLFWAFTHYVSIPKLHTIVAGVLEADDEEIA